ncbi:hypothetical protein WICPIJ_001218 [Wickerhamomyces pijperi]|uniref:J domain-containing protein n=1 Tax=Wickerhamomyces pijperi TaxID=599730 RepID=A0A9P8QDS0_WICPI|nr:hypothetical protein WICPIJ_001218 [Wickerhamomyces pijperi]
MKTDYYVLLDVESTASDSELKKAYRRKALQYHPDKNHGNVEEATRIFAEIRLAYEVLSDAQERAWYDAHKSQILREDTDRFNSDDEEEYVDPDITGLTAEDVLKYFNPSLYSSVGIYQSASVLLNRLAAEEILAGRQQGLNGYHKFQDDDPNDTTNVKYPKFGDIQSDYATQVRDFYQVWSSFSTVKTFSWVDEYRYSQAGDRRTRRAMERENKKGRDTAKKEYNETIRKYISFLKKRDSRVKDGIAEMERQKKRKQQEDLLRQIEKDRQNNLDKQQFEIQNWQKVDDLEINEIERHFVSDNEDGNNKDVNADLEIIECVICDKEFKTAKQFESHEKSQKHIKAVKQLRWEMKQEGISLGIDAVSDESDFETADEDDVGEDDELDDLSDLGDDLDYDEELRKIEEELKSLQTNDIDLHGSEDEVEQSKENSPAEVEIDDAIDESEVSEVESIQEIKPKKLSKKEKKKQKYQNNNNNNNKPQALQLDHSDSEDKDEEDNELAKLAAALEKGDSIPIISTVDSDDDWGNNKKKAKKKRVRKQADGSETPKDMAGTPEPEDNAIKAPIDFEGAEKCAVCDEVFSSRNKLFKHVTKTGHAAPPKTVASKEKKGKKGKKRQ